MFWVLINNMVCYEGTFKITKQGKFWKNSKGKLHRENDLPAIEYNNGTRKWYKDGKLHRENGPAVIKYFQNMPYEERWYLNGMLHRIDGPAVSNFYNGICKYQAWYLNNKYHRIGAPAVIFYDGDRSTNHYFIDGKYHREDGAAIEWNDYDNRRENEYYLNGIKVTKNDIARCFHPVIQTKEKEKVR